GIDHEMCQNILSNRTNLDLPLVRDQLARIVSGFPCPESNISIRAYHVNNPHLKIIAPNARSTRSINSITIKGCIKGKAPPECTIPMSDDPMFMIAFEDIRDGLIRCSTALSKAIQQGAEIVTWQKQNDPNKVGTNGIIHND